jgi:hypothetical protein
VRAHPLEAWVCAGAGHLIVPSLHDQFGVGEGIVAAAMILVEMGADQVADVARRQPQRRELIDNIVALIQPQIYAGRREGLGNAINTRTLAFFASFAVIIDRRSRSLSAHSAAPVMYH